MPSKKSQGAQQAGDYAQIVNPQGYTHNREITNLPGQWLVQGSQNVLIENAEKVVSSKGYELLGAVKTMNRGHDGSFDWATSTGPYRSLKGYYDRLEVWYKQAFRILKEGYTQSAFEATLWWDVTEQLDVMLSVRGSNKVEEWSGGIAEVAEITSGGKLRKKGWIQGVSGTVFTFADDGVNPATLTKSDGGFTVTGFATGDKITISGSTSNDGAYEIALVTDTVLTLIPDDSFVPEVSAPSTPVIIKWTKNGTWAEARFLTQNGGDASNRSVIVNGISVPYVGGETTGLLTIVGDFTGRIATGDIVYQEVRVYTVSGLGSNYQADIIYTINNQVVYGSKTNRRAFVSKNSDFTDFGFSTLRVPGEGATLDLDSCPTAFAKADQSKDGNVSGAFMISAGRSDWYRVTFVKSTSNDSEGVSRVSETTNVDHLPTAQGSAALGPGAIVQIRDAVTAITFEPAIDTLGHITNVGIDAALTVPLSDPIKLDIEAYDLAGVHGLYANRNLYYAIPAEGVVIIRDFTSNYWQPPQLLPISRLALIDVNEDGNPVLCGHASNCNETYILFKGLSANGSRFRPVAVFGYENYGSRFMLKSFDEAAVEMYASLSTIVKHRILYDFMGATDIREFDIDPSDPSSQFVPRINAGLGTVPLGTNPLGGASDDLSALAKIRWVSGTSVLDFFERQVIFYSDSEDPQFQIIAYGENIELSDNIPIGIKH